MILMNRRRILSLGVVFISFHIHQTNAPARVNFMPFARLRRFPLVISWLCHLELYICEAEMKKMNNAQHIILKEKRRLNFVLQYLPIFIFEE
jgi:hypothetical protein